MLTKNNNQMKKKLLSISGMCIAMLCFNLKLVAQQTDSVKAKAEYGFQTDDVKILAELEHIDYYKVSFTPKTLKGQPFLFFTTKEYHKGIVVNRDTLMPQNYASQYLKFKKIDSNTTISLTTKPRGDSVTFLYHIMGWSISRTYKRLRDDSYSLRDGLVTNEAFKAIPVNKTLPLFAYSLPYEDPKQPGYMFYCAITANGVPPEKWWETYKIPHFIIVEMKIVSNK